MPVDVPTGGLLALLSDLVAFMALENIDWTSAQAGLSQSSRSGGSLDILPLKMEPCKRYEYE